MMKKQFAVLLLLGIFCSQLVNAQSTKRYVVVEQFSNTFCPPCIFGTPEFKTNILDNYDQTDIFHVSYHVETPLPTDTFYLANPTEAADRQASYSTSGTPRMFMQGALQGFDADLLATSTLTPELGQTSPVKVSVDEIDNGDTRTATVTVSSLATPPSGAFALRVMVVERHINYDPPFTGMLPELENIFRKALNPWDATSIALPSAGSEDTYTFTYNEDLGWNADELYVLAFVQDVSTDEIINAGSTFQVEDTPTPVIAKMKVLLQGAYDAVNDIMRTSLQDLDLITLTHPFDVTPWNYTGIEQIASLTDLPNDVVDWVLVEARAANDNELILDSKAGFLKNDGTVLALDGSEGLTFDNLTTGDYYLVVRSRNHLAVMSATAVSLPNADTYDFSVETQVMGTGQLRLLQNGSYGLTAGDVNSDGAITTSDLNIYTLNSSAIQTYLDADLNLDQNVTVSDLNLYKPNSSAIGVPQVRY